ARRRAAAGRLPDEDAQRHLLPVRQGAEILHGSHLRQRRGGVAVPHHRAVGLLRAVGRRRAVPALLGDLPGRLRSSRGRADARNRRAARAARAEILTRKSRAKPPRRKGRAKKNHSESSLLFLCALAALRETVCPRGRAGTTEFSAANLTRP